MARSHFKFYFLFIASVALLGWTLQMLLTFEKSRHALFGITGMITASLMMLLYALLVLKSVYTENVISNFYKNNILLSILSQLLIWFFIHQFLVMIDNVQESTYIARLEVIEVPNPNANRAIISRHSYFLKGENLKTPIYLDKKLLAGDKLNINDCVDVIFIKKLITLNPTNAKICNKQIVIK
jgi:hypothetical protein